MATLSSEVDPREVAHIACDCVPDLGPEHCHLCSERAGHEVPWSECSSHSISDEDSALIRSIDNWTPALVRKYEESAFNYMVALVRALEAARGVRS